MSNIDLTFSPRIEIPYITKKEARVLGEGEKGWSLSSTYYLTEIRDIYLALKRKRYENLKVFTEFCLSIDLPFVRTPWKERRIYENLNALKNFSLINDRYEIVRTAFDNSKIGDKLSGEDLAVFRQTYFTYFRFKEILSWFVDLNPASRLALANEVTKADVENSSQVLFVFSENGRLKDNFLDRLEDNATRYFIKYKHENFDGVKEKGNEDLMRFWDVFVRWGTELNVLEHFSLRDLDITTSSGSDIVCCYVINNNHPDINLLDYIATNYNDSYIHLAELVFRIATQYRLSVRKAQELIMDQYRIHREFLSLERTSEIFIRLHEIRDEDIVLFPKYNDAYISHMVVRR
jgi:hypothetical protein